MGILKKWKFQALAMSVLLVAIPFTALAASTPTYCSHHSHDTGIAHYVESAADFIVTLFTGYVSRCAP